MHLEVLIGLLLAVACTAGASISGLWKQKGAVQTDAVDIRHPVRTAIALFRSKWFTIGWIVAAVAWGLHVGALAMAPISLAQAVISGGLVLLGVFAERFFGFKVSRRQWLGLLALAPAMVVLAVTSHSESNHTSFAIIDIAAFELVAMAFGIGFVMTHRTDRFREQRGVLLGVAAGILFGVADVSIKAVTSGAHGLLGILGPWTLAGLLCGLAAFYASARSLQIGDAVGVIAATATAANVLGIAGGIVVFGDPLGNDALTIAGRLAAFTLVVLAVGLMPAPVRAQEAVRDDEPEERQSEATAKSAVDSRPGPTTGEPAPEQALIGEQV
jgi:drug/metabolite transporter (DMT)-like permease